MECLLIVFATIWLLFASIADIKTKEVPDWLSYSFIGLAAFYRMFDFSLMYLVTSLAGIVFGYLLYRTGHWGGGDFKLLTAIAIAFPVSPLNKHSFFLVLFLLFTFLAGGLFAIAYAVYLAIKNKKKFKKNFKNLLIASRFYLIAIIATILFFEILIRESFAILLGILIVFLFFVFMFVFCVEKNFMIIDKPIHELVEGDMLVSDIYKNRKLICKARKIGLTKEDIQNLKKNGISKVKIKDGIPFVPCFFIGFITALILSLLWNRFF